MENEDGILEVIDGKQRIESIKKFKLSIKYLKDQAIFHQHFAPNELEVDNKTPWSLDGRTVLSNAQLLCSACNSRKNNRN